MIDVEVTKKLRVGSLPFFILKLLDEIIKS
jgi:hypothetical protein